MDDKQIKRLAELLGQSFAETMEPMMADIKDELSKNQDGLESVVQAISDITIDVPEVNIPEIRIPTIHVPEARVTVNTPATKFPEFPKFPEQRPIFSDVNLKNPLPVILTDREGRPYTAEQIIQSGGGGFKMINIGDVAASAYARMQNADGRLRVSVETGGSGLTDTELRATAVPVSQVSGASWSTSSSIDAQTITLQTQQVSGATDSVSVIGTVPVSGTFWQATQPVSGTFFQGTQPVSVASTLGVDQVSGANWSTNIIGTVPVSGTFFQATQPVSVALTLGVDQVSGATWSTSVIGSVAVTGPLTDTQVRATSLPVEQVSGSNWSTSVVTALPTGANTIGAVTLSGALTSAVVTGPSAVGTVDDGTAPVQIAGIARQANPTAITAGGVVKSTHDDLGRQVFRAHQVRDLISTARAVLTTGTETTLLAAVAGSFLDLVSVMCANNSDAATSVDLRAVTAGNIVQTIQVPANGTAGWAPQTPWPQDETGNAWSADLPDITGTTISISALFSREV